MIAHVFNVDIDGSFVPFVHLIMTVLKTRLCALFILSLLAKVQAYVC